MRALTRYILSQLVVGTVLVAIVLTFAVWLTQSLRLIDFIVNRGLPASTFLSFVALLLPTFLSIVLPIAAFCAVLFVYNKLTMESEMVVLRAAGLSQVQLALPPLLLGAGTMAVMYAITLYLLPLSYRNFKDLQYHIRHDYSAVLLQEGIFTNISDGITVYVRERGSEGELRGILVHDTRDSAKPVTMMAERGALVDSPEGPRVVMVNGNRQEVGADGRLSLLYFDQYSIEVTKLQDRLTSRWREPRERFLHELFGGANDEQDLKRRGELIAEGHQRILQPFYVLTFVMVGLAALLSGEFNRRGQLKRIFIAVGAVALLEGLNLALHDLASRYTALVAVMYLGPLLPIAASIYVLLQPARVRGGNAAALEGAP